MYGLLKVPTSNDLLNIDGSYIPFSPHENSYDDLIKIQIAAKSLCPYYDSSIETELPALKLLKPLSPLTSPSTQLFNAPLKPKLKNQEDYVFINLPLPGEMPDLNPKKTSVFETVSNVFFSIYSNAVSAGKKVSQAYTFITTPAHIEIQNKAKTIGSSAVLKTVHVMIHSTLLHVIIASIFLPSGLLYKGLVALLSYIFNSLDSSKENKTVIDRLVDYAAEKVFIPLSETRIFSAILYGFAKLFELFPTTESIFNLLLLIKLEHLDADKAKAAVTQSFGETANLEKELNDFVELIDPSLSYKEKIQHMQALLTAALDTDHFDDNPALKLKITQIIERIENSQEHFDDIVAVVSLAASRTVGKSVEYLIYAVNKTKKYFLKTSKDLSAEHIIKTYQSKAFFLPFALV